MSCLACYNSSDEPRFTGSTRPVRTLEGQLSMRPWGFEHVAAATWALLALMAAGTMGRGPGN